MNQTLTGRPDFIIIGAMKSATSTLHVQLAHQPGFWMSEPKEPNFFSDDDVWAKGLAWYASLFDQAPAGHLRGESSTHYTKLPYYRSCLARMREHVPDARLIYVMRHPIDRLVSHYMHGWLETSMSGDIDQAVQRYPQLVDYGRYAMQLRPFLETYGPDRVLPVFFERLTRHPQDELERVCRFLGYAGVPRWQETESRHNVSSERLRSNPLRDAVLDFPPLRMLRRSLVPKALRNRVKKAWQITEKPVLSAASQEWLTARFDEDLATLGNWLGVPLDCGTFKEAVRDRPHDWSPATPGRAQ